MFDLGSLGKWIIAIGVGLVLLGLLVWGMGRLGLRNVSMVFGHRMKEIREHLWLPGSLSRPAAAG
jgi:hypothetical protein